MSEAIIGGLIGGPLGAVIALLGNVFVVRDTRWGRVSASEEKAAATLLTQLRRIRADERFLHEYDKRFNFNEDCLTAIFAFRDRRVRDRLSRSIYVITEASQYRRMFGEEGTLEAIRLAAVDIRLCLMARLDRKRPPKPSPDWSEAVTSLHNFTSLKQEEFEEAERHSEIEREEAGTPGL
ncbi:hypothetical protein [Streptomyces sp. NPDC015125]|uniref:hypothetical protein n=1 Tax=Streptomyces sp. NPDC015125 TaxID=3364938 RepID=UPI0036F5A001